MTRARRALALVLTVAACRSDDRAPASRDIQAGTDSSAAATERPLWKFGEESTRTDVLPPPLDSMQTWGDYDTGERPVAYGVDLNGDGNMEWLVRGHRRVCGRAGCPVAVMTRAPGGEFIDVLQQTLARDVYVTSTRTGGWPVLWVLVGGRDGGVFRMVRINNRYELSRTLGRTTNGEERTAADDLLAARLSAVPTR